MLPLSLTKLSYIIGPLECYIFGAIRNRYYLDGMASILTIVSPIMPLLIVPLDLIYKTHKKNKMIKNFNAILLRH